MTKTPFLLNDTPRILPRHADWTLPAYTPPPWCAKTPPPLPINDGSADPPRLVTYGNMCSLRELSRLPRRRAWTREEMLDTLVEAGFHGFQAGPSEANAVRARGLRFCMSARIIDPHEAKETAWVAADSGADSLTVQAGWGKESDHEADALVRSILEASAARAIPLYIETHPETLSQNIWRINALIRRIPEIRFTGDFSHFYFGQTMTHSGFKNSRGQLTEILKRTNFLHGRLSESEWMVAETNDEMQNAPMFNFQSLWREAMGFWLETAQNGDLLPFIPEWGLPAPSCARTDCGKGAEKAEWLDRWQQTLVLKQLAEKAFASAQKDVAQPMPLWIATQPGLIG